LVPNPDRNFSDGAAFSLSIGVDNVDALFQTRPLLTGISGDMRQYYMMSTTLKDGN
jgi:hypothetical protein